MSHRLLIISKTLNLFSKEWEFVRLAVSFVLINCTENLMAFITIMFAGHLGPAHLAGVGLANTLFNLVVVPISAGFSSVFDTYGPQVHGSKGELGTLFLKCLFQGWLSLLFVLGPYLNVVFVIDLLPDSTLQLDDTSVDKLAIGGEDDYRDIAVKYLRITFLMEFFITPL